LSFFGGEPLLYFNKVIKNLLISVSELCAAKNVQFSSSMTTNGLLINQEMLDICKKYYLHGFQITLDGNKEQHDKVRFLSEGRGSFDKIVSNIKLAARNRLSVTVRINCSAVTMININDIMHEFDDLLVEERQFLNFDLQKVWQETENVEASMTETRFLFKENGFFVNGISGNTGSILNSCYADKRYQATINYNGEVFKCTARDFKDNSGEGRLSSNGEIVWNDKFEIRMNAKFKNKPCMECAILPLCAGGCSQHALEANGQDYCVMGYDEDAKIQMVKNKFKTMIS
jgi:uncharacterized protein